MTNATTNSSPRSSGAANLASVPKQASADAPKPIVQRLNAEFAKAISTPQVQTFYKASTLVVEANTPDEFAAFAKADREAAAKVFKSIGITPQAVPQ